MALPAGTELKFQIGLRPQAPEWKHIEGEAQNKLLHGTRHTRAMPHNSWQSRVNAT